MVALAELGGELLQTRNLTNIIENRVDTIWFSSQKQINTFLTKENRAFEFQFSTPAQKLIPLRF